MPRNQRAETKALVGDFVVNEILRFVGSGKSPVKGEKSTFPRLTKEYAQDKKGGNTTANLDLMGDMLDSLTFKNTRNGIEVGIFQGSEVPKADGHNNFSGESKLPRRRFIPSEDQGFRQRIERGIKDIVQSAEEGNPSGPSIADVVQGLAASPSVSIEVTVSELFGESLVDDLFG